MENAQDLSGGELRRLLALLLVSAAAADDQIHPREEKLIRTGLGTEAYRAALAEYRDGSDADREALHQEIKAGLANSKAREKALHLLKRLFLADGRYGPEEAAWMERVWSRIRD